MISEAIARPMPTGDGSGSPRRQGADRLEGHVGGQGEERERHQSQRLPLARLRQPVAELPQDDQPAGDLDDRVQAEADEATDPAMMPAVTAMTASTTL